MPVKSTVDALERVHLNDPEVRIIYPSVASGLRHYSSQAIVQLMFGVAPEAQGRGIYRSLMIGAMLWFRTRGTARMVVSTQVTNAAVQKVWTRLGFEPWKSNYTFHKWF